MPPPFGPSSCAGCAWARVRRSGARVEAGRRSSSATTTSAAKACSRRRRVEAVTVLEVNAPVIDYPGSTKALVDRALLVEPMRRWRDRICRRADLIVTPSAAILPAETPARKIVGSNGARTRSGSGPASRRRRAVRAAAGDGRDLRRGVPELARRHQPGARRARAAQRGAGRSRRGLHRRRSRAAGGRARSRRARQRHRHRRRAARRDAGVPGGRGHRRRAVRHRRASPAVARLLLVAAQDVRVHGRRAAGRRAGASTGFRRWSSDGREGLLYDPAEPGALAAALEQLDRPVVAPRRWARPRARAPSASTAGRRTARRSMAAIERGCSRCTMQPAIDTQHPARFPTDAFPPVCGGSGWSTYELARGLRRRGHEITIVQPRPGTPAGRRERDYDGFRVIELGAPAPPLPYVRNYFKNERLYPRLAAPSRRTHRPRAHRARARAARARRACPRSRPRTRRGVPTVCTVRDYWPVCYWSDLIHTRTARRCAPAAPQA